MSIFIQRGFVFENNPEQRWRFLRRREFCIKANRLIPFGISRLLKFKLLIKEA
jgi:hypothetical protein